MNVMKVAVTSGVKKFFSARGTGIQSDGMTASELKQHVENWMSKLQVTVKYDPSEALKQLETLGLLTSKQKGILE